jgi:putative ABC transport system substrate-binding protein
MSCQVLGVAMRRRTFITLLGGAAATWPLVTQAQKPAIPVIGFLHSGSPKPTAHLVAAFRKGLGETGYLDGQNVAIEFRWAEGQYDRLPELAADLVRRRVAVIATPGSTPAALAAKAATTTIPIVFATGGDAIALGLVASLSRPGGNLTGYSLLNTELTAKRLGFLRELVPGAAHFVALVNPNSDLTNPAIKDLQAGAATIGLQIEILSAGSDHEIDAAFASLAQKPGSTLIVTPDQFLASRDAQIVALAARHAVPAIYPLREYSIAGGLISYGPNFADAYQQVGIYTGRILKGEKPADLAVQQSTKFELVINLKTAKALGLTVPFGLLNAADEVIE